MELGDDYEYTDTGIPLAYRFPTVFDIPVDVRPVVNAKPLSNYPKGPTGQPGPGPRQGRDRKTFWCLSCDTAVDKATKTWCRKCELARNSAGRKESRADAAGRPTHITFPVDVLTELVRRSDAVIERIGDATLEFDRPHMTGGAIDDLMLATKDLAGYLSREVRPAVQGAKHRTVTAEEVQRNNARQGSPTRRPQ